ncbi:MAG TPA: polynucleotide adenylyltransferase PcnB, partial [Accumulibacter sp.]|nr:polynucleotide adenylyltransferase PcnB [Accumulibacter sp.]
MIRKFISRVLGRSTPTDAVEPAIIPVEQHGLQRDQISRACRRTIETLQESGYQAYVVGGAVRDLLAGLTP